MPKHFAGVPLVSAQSILAVKYKENTGLSDCKNQGSLSDRKCLPKNCYGLDGAMSLADGFTRDGSDASKALGNPPD